MLKTQSRVRAALLCSLLLALCVLAAYPFATVGGNDDFSYIRSAKALAETGHIVYFGWASAMLGWQLALGAAFIKVFGFSLTVARFSMLSVALCTASLIQRTFVRAGLSERNSVFATLTLVLSPLFVPLSFSFMSDIPGLFAIVLSLYLCLRAIGCERPGTAAWWLIGACVASAVLGTARQTGWLGLLVVVPSACWLLRRQRLPWLRLALVWVAGVVFVAWCLVWFNHQMYATLEEHPSFRMNRLHLVDLAHAAVRLPLDMALLLLPILVMFWTKISLKSQRILQLVLLLQTAYMFLRLHRWAVAIMLTPPSEIGNYVTAQGLLALPDIGNRAELVPTAMRVIIVLLCCYSAASFLVFVLRLGSRQAIPVGRAQLPISTLLVLVGPLSLAYSMFLAIRILGATMFDRYTLPLLLVLALLATRLYQDHVRENIPLAAYAVLCFMAVFAVAGTHDVFAADRARARAINELQAAGLNRSDFYGGFGYDGWTQIDNQGYIYAADTRTESGKLIANVPVTSFDPCGYTVAHFFPSIHPKYAISYDDVACSPQRAFAPIAYRTWLPPFSSHLYIRAIDAATAARIAH